MEWTRRFSEGIRIVPIIPILIDFSRSMPKFTRRAVTLKGGNNTHILDLVVIMAIILDNLSPLPSDESALGDLPCSSSGLQNKHVILQTEEYN